MNFPILVKGFINIKTMHLGFPQHVWKFIFKRLAIFVYGPVYEAPYGPKFHNLDFS